MHRLILLLSIIPLLAAIILRRLNADRILRRDGQLPLSKPAGDTARKMLDAMGHQQTKLRQRKSPWSVPGRSAPSSHVELPDFARGKSNPATVESHALAALRVGIFLLAQREPALAAKRTWALRFGHVFPVFTAIVLVFAILVGKLPVLLALSILAASLGLATCAQTLALACELRAANLATAVLEKKRILPRLADEERVTTATRAQAWRAIVPGLLARLM